MRESAKALITPANFLKLARACPSQLDLANACENLLEPDEICPSPLHHAMVCASMLQFVRAQSHCDNLQELDVVFSDLAKKSATAC